MTRRAARAYPAHRGEFSSHWSERRQLVRDVLAGAQKILAEHDEPPISRAVVRALLRAPREAFVPQHESALAYANTALTIGHGQTISQPVIVALMTQLLSVTSDDKVLEIGTGSGYQSAVLADVVRHVYSVETISELGMAARERLRKLGYSNITVSVGDGALGWAEHAPYEGVIVTAATPSFPQSLIDQLRIGRRMVIPLGGQDEVQWLSVIEKCTRSDVTVRRIIPVRFVPLI